MINSRLKESSSLVEPLLPTNIHHSGHIVVTHNYNLPSNTSSPVTIKTVLRMRERYILYLTIVTFAIFCVAGFFFLPELKAGTSIAIAKVKDAGPDLIGIIPPVEHHHQRLKLNYGHNNGLDSEQQQQLNANIPAPEYVFPISKPTPRNRMSDMQRLAEKIRNDQMAAINRSQHDAVLPRPRSFGANIDIDASSSSSDGRQHVNDDDMSHVIPAPHVIVDNVGLGHRNSASGSFLGSTPDDPETLKRRNHVKSMMKHAWDNYVRFAWGENELRPITKTGHSPGIFGSTKMGASIIDAMDTLLIMGLNEEFNQSRSFVKTLSLEDVTSDISVFEFNIRFIGGLLSAYALTKDDLFKRKAEYFANIILPAFNTPTGIPNALINPKTGHSKNYAWASGGASILAEFGSLHLEFVYLSEITGNPIYKEKVIKIRNHLNGMTKPQGLYPNYVNPRTGNWGQHHISMGALGDSFYEYLLKAWLQSGKSDAVARAMYDEAIEAVDKNLVQTSSKSNLIYIAEMKYDRTEHKMDHLACFSGGLFALGAVTDDNHVHPKDKKSLDLTNKYLKLGQDIANTCHESYVRTATKIGPESFRFSDQIEAVASRMNEKYYILRPEVVETYFYLWRLTKDVKYRDWAWDVVESLERHCRVDHGYTGLKNVYDVNSPKDDVQQSFLFAELFKYLYLIFSNDDTINLNDWVFNTEAHPLPVLAGGV